MITEKRLYQTLETLNPLSKVWIYQSNKPLDDTQQDWIADELNRFIHGWQAHGNDLMAGFEIKFGRFIILAVDEQVAMATGCSIDKSVALVRKIATQLNVDFFDRMLIGYIENGQPQFLPYHEFEREVSALNIDEDQIVFNNVVNNLQEYKDKWMIPLRDSWHSRLLPS